MEKAGATRFVVACNTAHIYAEEIQAGMYAFWLCTLIYMNSSLSLSFSLCLLFFGLRKFNWNEVRFAEWLFCENVFNCSTLKCCLIVFCDCCFMLSLWFKWYLFSVILLCMVSHLPWNTKLFVGYCAIDDVIFLVLNVNAVFTRCQHTDALADRVHRQPHYRPAGRIGLCWSDGHQFIDRRSGLPEDDRTDGTGLKSGCPCSWWATQTEQGKHICREEH